MKKIIKKSEASMLLAKPTIEVEIRYTNRKEFQDILKRCRANEVDMIIMPRAADISRNPEDVKAACREVAKMGKGITFVQDKLTGEDVIKMSYDELQKITLATLKDDMVVIVDSPEEALTYINEEKQNEFQQMFQ